VLVIQLLPVLSDLSQHGAHALVGNDGSLTDADRTRTLAKADIFEYMEMFYNRTRRHSRLGGVSPETFEAASNRGLYVSTGPGKVQPKRFTVHKIG
jgi:hypothetical protein